MRKILLFVLLISCTITAFGQIYKPVKWTFSSLYLGGNDYELVFTATINKSWYVFGLDIPDDGPNPTVFYFDKMPKGIQRIGKIKESQRNRVEGFDKTFEIKIVKFKNKAIFTQKIKATNVSKPITGYLEFMTCNHERCLPPKEVDFSIQLSSKD